MENYICINGKKTELTDEQLKQLGIETKKNLWIGYKNFTPARWVCPKCRHTVGMEEDNLKKVMFYCNMCGNKNILD